MSFNFSSLTLSAVNIKKPDRTETLLEFKPFLCKWNISQCLIQYCLNIKRTGNSKISYLSMVKMHMPKEILTSHQKKQLPLRKKKKIRFIENSVFFYEAQNFTESSVKFWQPFQ